MTTNITKAFVLGAGLGTRLRPLTETTPKPLIPIFGKPLITFALDHLMAIGIRSFVINTHRLADQFGALFPSGKYAGAPVRLTHEPELLETGGGIKNAQDFLKDGPFITYSGDILCDVRLEPLVEEHFRRGNDVTLGLRNTGLASAIALRDGRIVDITNKYGTPGTYDFANVAVWNPDILDRLEPLRKVSFIPVLVDWIGAGGKIGGVVLNDGKWFNVGSAQDYLDVHRTILTQNWRPQFVRDSAWPQPVDPSATISATARLLGCTVIGANCRVDAAALLEDTILWEGAEITSRSHLSRCIVRSRQTASGEHHDEVL
ncbi:MAG TPA: NDP-sugar synthase [Chthoniobacterales bacterium]|nr:NDP-sugar synthase [Chthoniobacterales bacterium]